MDRLACGGMAGFKVTVGFLFVFVCFASVPSVNGKPRSSTILKWARSGLFYPAVGALLYTPVCLTVRTFVGSCSSDSQCSPGICIQNRCLCPEGYSGPNCAATGECVAFTYVCTYGKSDTVQQLRTYVGMLQATYTVQQLIWPI